jgi:PAS domain S-box-containing protein
MSDVAQTSPLAALAASTPEVASSERKLETLISNSERAVIARTNRLFAWLLVLQWLLAIAFATWLGAASGAYSPHKVAIFVGAALTLPALALIRWLPQHVATRSVVGLSQVGFSALLILLSGGRIETHFHIFGSMAFLALYRDWRVLPLATIVILAHHAIVGWWWPESLYGASQISWWRPVEDAAWLLFENVVLIWSCVNSRREMAEICRGQQQNQQLLQQLEQRVAERTHQLEAEVQERIRTARELELGEAQRRQLVATLPIGIFESTRSGKVLFANPYLVGLIGLPANFDFRMLSMSDGQIFPNDDRERFWSKLETDGEVRGFAATFRHFDGSPFEVVINARVKNKASEGELVCEGTLEDVSVRKRAERELDALHSQLLIASRQAGMAEVATGVLHNVGNVLTSVNLIVHDVQDRLKTTRLTHLRRVVEILQREQPRLAEFLTADNAGRQLPDFLAKLDEHLTTENRQLLTDVEGLVRHFEHIREIIVTQQGSAQLFGVLENLNPAQLFEDALRLNAESLERHGVALERLFDPVGMVKADRHKVLQILVNLLKNAKDALQVLKPGERRIRVCVTPAPEGLIALKVEDNGPGIAAANLRRIFQHGFTTKKSGHGFGLHSSVLAAREMGGDLVAESAGPGKGATFILSLPAVRTPAS